MAHREVRRVPANWEHPRDKQGEYIPLGEDFLKAAARWDEGQKKWHEGFYNLGEGWWPKTSVMTYSYQVFAGPRPKKKDYMPSWPESERTHYQMYEITTDGTPISPVLETPEELAHWLDDHRAPAWGGQPTSYDEWLSVIQAGSGQTT